MLIAAVVASAGCGITPDAIPNSIAEDRTAPRQGMMPKRHESPRYSWHRTKPAPRKSSRFEDIKRVSFFDGPAPETARPEVPPPAPASDAMESAFQPTYVTRSGPVREAPTPVVAIPETGRIADLPSCGPVTSTIELTQAQTYENEGKIPEPVDDPRKLKKITEILPYSYYEPDPDVRAKDPCQNLCPRPDGAPCQTIAGKPPLCPEEVLLSSEEYAGRAFVESVYGWEASNVHYNPLYFEDFALERYGHTYPCWVQPFASVGKFSVQLVGLPYQMAIDPVCKKMYPLGYYRPGECAPKLCYQIPWNTKAAIAQAGVTTGLFFLIP